MKNKYDNLKSAVICILSKSSEGLEGLTKNLLHKDKFPGILIHVIY